jgi:hypothetical protein
MPEHRPVPILPRHLNAIHSGVVQRMNRVLIGDAKPFSLTGSAVADRAARALAAWLRRAGNSLGTPVKCCVCGSGVSVVQSII